MILKYLIDFHMIIVKNRNGRIGIPHTHCMPRGWTWHIYKQGSAEYFLGFESRMPVFFWVLVKDAVCFWVVK